MQTAHLVVGVSTHVVGAALVRQVRRLLWQAPQQVPEHRAVSSLLLVLAALVGMRMCSGAAASAGGSVKITAGSSGASAGGDLNMRAGGNSGGSASISRVVVSVLAALSSWCGVAHQALVAYVCELWRHEDGLYGSIAAESPASAGSGEVHSRRAHHSLRQRHIQLTTGASSMVRVVR